MKYFRCVLIVCFLTLLLIVNHLANAGVFGKFTDGQKVRVIEIGEFGVVKYREGNLYKVRLWSTKAGLFYTEQFFEDELKPMAEK
jgi:hypothetical protein